MLTFKEVAPTLYKGGYEVLPIKLGSKAPAISEWSTVTIDQGQLRKWYSNGVAQGGAGIRLGGGVLALDVDVDDAEVSQIVQDQASVVLGFAPTRIGQAPRCAMLYGCASEIKKTVLKLIDPVGAAHKVELLGKGQQVVAFGVHPGTGSAYTWVDDSPLDCAVADLPEIEADQIAELFAAIGAALPTGWRVDAGNVAAVDVGCVDDDLISFVENNPDRVDMTDDEIGALLDGYTCAPDYDGWLRFMLACYHQSGGSAEGLRWAHSGCAGLDGYDAKEIDAKWRSGTLKALGDRKPITFASVLAELGDKRKAVAVKESMGVVEALRERIQSADEATVRGELATAIRKVNIDPLDRELLAKCVQGRLKELVGVSFPIAKVRTMLMRGGKVEGDKATPDWCNDWVYIGSHDGLFCLDDRQVYKASGFNLKCGQHVPANDTGQKPSAFKFVSDSGYVEAVNGMAYLPGVSDVVCTLPNGSSVVNTFNPNSIPKAQDSVSVAGGGAVDVVRRHLRVLCGDDEAATVLEQWLAHQVQNPGIKLLWAPLIQSIQGTGKSFIAALLGAVIGDANVGVVSPQQVVSDYNGWATGVCVNVLEELRISGHNRHEAANALKPLITDRYIQVVDKHVKAFKTINTSNYICFTNFRDAVPLEDGDRRWWVIFSPVDNLDDIGKKFDMSRETYFDELWTSLRSHGGCLRRWLLDYQISAEFKALTKAPDSIYKDAMIATERSGIEFMDELAELIEVGGNNYNKDVVCSADLFAAAEFEIDGFLAASSQRNLLLKRLGYIQLPKPMKIDGKTKRVWVKQVTDADSVRELLHPVPF